MKKQKIKSIFDLKEVGYTDLEGVYHFVNLDQKNFANAVWRNAASIDTSIFSEEVFSKGKAELTDQTTLELLQLIPLLYGHRVAQALIDYINTLKNKIT